MQALLTDQHFAVSLSNEAATGCDLPERAMQCSVPSSKGGCFLLIYCREMIVLLCGHYMSTGYVTVK